MKHVVLTPKKLSINTANFITRRNHYLFGLMIAILPITAISDNIQNPEVDLDEIRDAVVAQLLYLENKGHKITSSTFEQLNNAETKTLPKALLNRVEKHALAQLAIIKKTALQREEASIKDSEIESDAPNNSPTDTQTSKPDNPASKPDNDNTALAQAQQSSTAQAQQSSTAQTQQTATEQVKQTTTSTAATETATTKATAKAPSSTEDKPAAKEKTDLAALDKDATVGWIYLGRFDKERWENPTLNVKTELPQVEEEYKVTITSVNIRDKLPKKNALGELKLGKLVKVILNKQVIKVLELKRSGKNNHYWGKILLE